MIELIHAKCESATESFFVTNWFDDDNDDVSGSR